MKDFEISIPASNELKIDVTDKTLYSYDFNSYSLALLQKQASLTISEKIRKNLYSNVSSSRLVKAVNEKDKVEYVANISDFAKGKIESGEWTLALKRETGETIGVIKDKVSGKYQNFVTLDKRNVNQLGRLPELAAIQGQLVEIAEQIENLNHLVERVEQGQYNDRYAGFYTARQLLIEGLVSSDNTIKKELLLEAIKISNTTIGQLMLSIRQDSIDFIDMNTKKKEANRIEKLVQSSLGYLNSSIQLNLVAYTALEEEKPLMATLNNYNSFINQTLLKEFGNSNNSVAWKMDNAHKGYDGNISQLTLNISKGIDQLLEESEILRIGDEDNGETGTKYL